MIKSMTGYGRSEKLFDDYKINVEIKSVNNRYLDLNIKVYKQYSFLEEVVRECATKLLSRGKVDIFVQIEPVGNKDITVTLNEGLAIGYYNAMTNLIDTIDIRNDISASSFLRIPDVFKVEKTEDDVDKIISDAKEVINEALEDLTNNRIREGQRLKEFFDECIISIKSIVDVISERSPMSCVEHEQKMKQRINELLDGVEVDEARLLTEVAIFADKVNITEEIIRFNSHLQEYVHLMTQDIPVGRKLDFLIQELNREANTMGSKCNDYIISKSVIELKSEIEKLREQVQNIE